MIQGTTTGGERDERVWERKVGQARADGRQWRGRAGRQGQAGASAIGEARDTRRNVSSFATGATHVQFVRLCAIMCRLCADYVLIMGRLCADYVPIMGRLARTVAGT